MVPGQLAAGTYEESQRRPGDYEAQVSQRPISAHGLEHLGATDRGVAMYRKLLRKGIQAVRDGQDPLGLSRAGAVLPTFCNNTVVRQPPAADADTDLAMLRATSRRLVDTYLEAPPLQTLA